MITDCSKDDSRTQYSSEDIAATTTIPLELHKFNIHGRTATAEPLIIENNTKR